MIRRQLPCLLVAVTGRALVPLHWRSFLGRGWVDVMSAFVGAWQELLPAGRMALEARDKSKREQGRGSGPLLLISAICACICVFSA
jgi:hypothetical protein